MDYKSLMGYGGKNKVTKEKPQPKTNKILESVKKEFGYINEGPAFEYAKHIKKIDKLYDAYGAAVGDFETLLNKKGLKKEARDVKMMYGKFVFKFQKAFESMVRKLL